MTTGKLTKKTRILQLYPEFGDVEALARELETSPSYVANTLIAAGFPVAYSDVFTSSQAPRSRYARLFAGALKFRDEATARESLAHINDLHGYFEAERDFRGMYEAQVLVLLGKLRAQALGKDAISRLFHEWLVAH